MRLRFDDGMVELASESWLMRRATKKGVKRLMKKDVNVVGYLISQLENGDTKAKVAACAGLGNLEKKAQGSVGALGKALSFFGINVLKETYVIE